MVEIKIELSEDLNKKMKGLPLDWSLVISSFIREKVLEWAKLRSIIEGSKLSEEDALVIGEKINKGLATKYKSSRSST